MNHPAERKKWEAEAEEDDFIKELGTAVWRAPTRRHEVPSLPTGPDQELSFNVDYNRHAVDLASVRLIGKSFFLEEHNDASIINLR